jgi:hypothetical protein
LEERPPGRIPDAPALPDDGVHPIVVFLPALSKREEFFRLDVVR